MSMTHDEKIALIQADFCFDAYDYRIKLEPPKPREWWIRLCGGRIPTAHVVFTDHEVARDWLASCDE